MHLREYTYSEIALAAGQAGFGRVEALFRLPDRLRRPLRLSPMAAFSGSYLRYLQVVEWYIQRTEDLAHRARLAARLRRLMLFPKGIFICAVK